VQDIEDISQFNTVEDYFKALRSHSAFHRESEKCFELKGTLIGQDDFGNDILIPDPEGERKIRIDKFDIIYYFKVNCK
jgi:hypothetical protein